MYNFLFDPIVSRRSIQNKKVFSHEYSSDVLDSLSTSKADCIYYNLKNLICYRDKSFLIKFSN